MRFALSTTIVALAVLAAAAPRPSVRGSGLAIPIAKRSSLTNADKTVNMEALNAHVQSVKAKIDRGLNNYEKNTGTPHPSVLKGNQKRATAALPLTDDNSQLWYGSISVGTPSSTFTVDFDTGSSDLFLPGPNCSKYCEGHAIYTPNSSSSSQDLDKTADLKYGDNSMVSVELYTDNVSIMGLTATEQTLGAATQYSSSLAPDSFPPDGLLGMAFESISAYNAPPVFQTLMSQGQADNAAFSFKLASSGSELYLGGANSDLYTGDFVYVPVTTEGFWEVTMDNIQGNGKTIISNVDTIIDTGTTLILGPPSSVKTFYDALGGTPAPSAGDGYYTFPCNDFPSVDLTFGGTSFTISNEYLNLGAVSSGSDQCVSGIVGQSGTPSSSWVIGDVFLMNVYTTFDVGNSQVGFAQLA